MDNSKSEGETHDLNRRKFIATNLKAAAATAFLAVPAINVFAMRKEYTVQDVIDLILKEIPIPPFKQSVDTIKSGSNNQKVKGIVTTMFATVEAIKKAVALNANFIIAHEPTFYNHTDDMNWTGNNEIVKQKKELLNEHGLVVWRFHELLACLPARWDNVWGFKKSKLATIQ